MQDATPTPQPTPVAPAPTGTPVPTTKKPAYKEVWFWVVMGGVGLILLSSIFVFATTAFMVRGASNAVRFSTQQGSGSGFSQDDNAFYNGQNGCPGDCGCSNGGVQGYDYQNNSGDSTDSYNNGGGSGSTQEDPFSQYPEEFQEQLRQYHQGLDGFEDLQQYKQTTPEDSSSNL